KAKAESVESKQAQTKAGDEPAAAPATVVPPPPAQVLDMEKSQTGSAITLGADVTQRQSLDVGCSAVINAPDPQAVTRVVNRVTVEAEKLGIRSRPEAVIRELADGERGWAQTENAENFGLRADNNQNGTQIIVSAPPPELSLLVCNLEKTAVANE